MISIGVSLDFISFSSKRFLSSGDCLSVTECLDFPCDLKEEEQVSFLKVASQQHLKHHHLSAKQQIAIGRR